MTATTVGREPIQIVEIDQDLCANTYGVAPCTAAGAAGSECFNTRKTCQDTPNYDGSSTLTLRFVTPVAHRVAGEYLIPSLASVKISPTEINAGGGNKDRGPLGVRGSATITLTDHPHTDRLVDPYRTTRAYIATDRSTFWAKWLARNPYYQGRLVRILDGYAGQTLAQMTVRTYVLDRVSGPDSNGRVTITAKDVLTLAADNKAQAPAISTGELIEAEGAAETTLRVTGALAAAYPAPGTVRINREVITYTGVSTISGTEINLTGCARGTNGTTAAAHDAGDRVQLCLVYTATNAADIASDLLTTYAGVPAAFIPTTDWNAERDVWLTPYTLSAIITEPTSVNQLLGELSEQCLFYIWWDDRAQEIKLRAIRPATETPTALDDTGNILADSTQLAEDPRGRISQVWTFFNQKDPTESLTDENNYSVVRIRADLEREGADQYGSASIRKIYSRWLSTDGQAANLNARLLARYGDNPRYMTLRLDAKDGALWTGDLVDVTHRNLVDFTGQPEQTRFQVISANEVDSGHVIEYKLLKFEFVGRFAYWMDNGAPVFTSATDEEKATGLWWSDASGKMSDGSDGYTWQ